MTKEEYFDIYDINRCKIGKIKRRGERLDKGEYHLFVQVWLINDRGEYLVQERSENVSWPLMWCANGGNAKCGEDGYSCARREVLEELKTDISALDGFMFNSSIYEEDNQSYFCDSFVYRCSKKLSEYEFQKEEIKTIKFMKIKRIKALMKKGVFFTYDDDYLNKLDYISKMVKNKKIDKISELKEWQV